MAIGKISITKSAGSTRGSAPSKRKSSASRGRGRSRRANAVQNSGSGKARTGVGRKRGGSSGSGDDTIRTHSTTVNSRDPGGSESGIEFF